MGDGGFVAKGRQRLAKRGPQRVHQLRRMLDIRRVEKEIGRRGLLPLREFGKPDREKVRVLRHIVAADKPHHWMLRCDERMNRHFRLFALGVDHRRAVSSTARNAWRHSFGSASLPGGAAGRPFHAERHEKDH